MAVFPWFLDPEIAPFLQYLDPEIFLSLNFKGGRFWGTFVSGGPLGSVDLGIVVARWSAKTVG